jgi:inorganic pyrophosphatase
MAEGARRDFDRFLFRHHPWHGVEVGKNAPTVVNAYVEITPADTVKYEVDKQTGFLKVDRPQAFSSQCPSMYGFIPRTYCGGKVAGFFAQKMKMEKVEGDGDPLDICILSERPIFKSDILVEAKPIGGLRMIDNGEADDKIVAVLRGDLVYGNMTAIEDCPHNLIDRLRHYFLTYKDFPSVSLGKTEIAHTYGREEAFEVIRLARQDYEEKFTDLSQASKDVMGE